MPEREHHARVKALFLRAGELEPERRASYLEEACAGDTRLRAEIEALLGFEARRPRFLEHGADVIAAPTHRVRPAPLRVRRVGCAQR